MSKAACHSLQVVKINHLIWTVSIGIWSKYTKRNNLGIWVHVTELTQEWNGTTHTITSSWFVIEVLSRSIERFFQPWGKFLHAPPCTGMATLDSDFSTIWDICGQFFSKSCLSNLWVHLWTKSHG